MKAWNILLRTIVDALLKTKCDGRFVKNKRYQETGKEYFTIVQMDAKDKGYQYFVARAAFDALLYLLSPPSAPKTHAQQEKGPCLPNDLCLSYHQPTQPFFQFPIMTKAQVFLAHNCPKIRENLFHKSWKFT